MTRVLKGQVLRRGSGPVSLMASRGGQVNIEITFGMIVIVLLILGMVRVFFWVSNDITARRMAHEATLTQDIGQSAIIDDNYRQLRPVFFEGLPIDGAAVNSEIWGVDRMGSN